MTDSTIPTSAVPGYSAVVIPFPAKGPWIDEGQSLDLGNFKSGMCSGRLYKTAENELHVYIEVMTWGDRFIKEYMPLYVPDEGESTLYIRWREEGVVLRQDDREPIDSAWQQSE